MKIILVDVGRLESGLLYIELRKHFKKSQLPRLEMGDNFTSKIDSTKVDSTKLVFIETLKEIDSELVEKMLRLFPQSSVIGVIDSNKKIPRYLPKEVLFLQYIKTEGVVNFILSWLDLAPV